MKRTILQKAAAAALFVLLTAALLGLAGTPHCAAMCAARRRLCRDGRNRRENQRDPAVL